MIQLCIWIIWRMVVIKLKWLFDGEMEWWESDWSNGNLGSKKSRECSTELDEGIEAIWFVFWGNEELELKVRRTNKRMKDPSWTDYCNEELDMVWSRWGSDDMIGDQDHPFTASVSKRNGVDQLVNMDQCWFIFTEAD